MSMDAPNHPKGSDFECSQIYHAAVRPGHACWVSLWRAPCGDLMLAFMEQTRRRNNFYRPVSLEFFEALGLPLKYHVSVCNGAPDVRMEQVVMRSGDEGQTWGETGRSECGMINLFAYASLPNGDILRGADTSLCAYFADEVPRAMIQKSSDGGNTWTDGPTILEDFFSYCHRLKRLSDGTLVLLCGYMPAFGSGRARRQRVEERPHVIHEVTASLLYSVDDGRTWTNPQTVLPGVCAWEPDFVELPCGDILVINSRVQHAAGAKQTIHKTPHGWVPGPVFAIASEGVPESVWCTSDGLLVGSTRGMPYTCSNDQGDTWYPIEALPNCEYQPMTIELKDGRFLTAWHMHGDCVFGEHDQFVGQHVFSLNRAMPARTMLELRRDLNPSRTRYLNAFTATLSAEGEPISGRTVVFTVQERYRDTYDLEPPEPSPYTIERLTDGMGEAHIHLEGFDRERNIHNAVTIGARFVPLPGDGGLAPCESSRTHHYALTPERGVGNPYGLYVSGTGLFLRSDVRTRYPEIASLVAAMWETRGFGLADAAQEVGVDPARLSEVLGFLAREFVVDQTETGYRWRYCLSGGVNLIESEDDLV
ncbi:MAG: sialidase family protein [Candidatus Latescibacterota bacterium]